MVKRGSAIWKTLGVSVALTFVVSLVCMDLCRVKVSDASVPGLPPPGEMLSVSRQYALPVLKGLHLDPDNPLHIDFIIDSGNEKDVSQEDVSTLIRYFLAALTVPQSALWVNLSPYESDRVIDESLGITDLGRDMLAQDYLLKQLAASLTHPDTPTGRAYWCVENGKSTIENRLGKIWIMPDKAEVYESGTTAVITEASLKLQCEDEAQSVLLPVITQDVNHGKNFARLRQMYHAILLGLWFKHKFAESFYAAYLDKSKVTGIDLEDKALKDKIYATYVKAFEKGVYDVICAAGAGSPRPQRRRYFSGGVGMDKFKPGFHAALSVVEDALDPQRFAGSAIVAGVDLADGDEPAVSSPVSIDFDGLYTQGYEEFKVNDKTFAFTMRRMPLKSDKRGEKEAVIFEIFDITQPASLTLAGYAHMVLNPIRPKRTGFWGWLMPSDPDAYMHVRLGSEARSSDGFTPQALNTLGEKGIDVSQLIEAGRWFYHKEREVGYAIETEQKLGRPLFAACLMTAVREGRRDFKVEKTLKKEFFTGFIVPARRAGALVNKRADQDSNSNAIFWHDIQISLPDDIADSSGRNFSIRREEGKPVEFVITPRKTSSAITRAGTTGVDSEEDRGARRRGDTLPIDRTTQISYAASAIESEAVGKDLLSDARAEGIIAEDSNNLVPAHSLLDAAIVESGVDVSCFFDAVKITEARVRVAERLRGDDTPQSIVSALDEVLKEYGMDGQSISELLRRAALDLFISNEAMYPRGVFVVARRMIEALELQLLPDEVYMYRSVSNVQYAGKPGIMTPGASFWSIDRNVADGHGAIDGVTPVMVRTTLGQLRAHGIVVADPRHERMYAVTVAHHDTQTPIPYTVESSASALARERVAGNTGGIDLNKTELNVKSDDDSSVLKLPAGFNMNSFSHFIFTISSLEKEEDRDELLAFAR